MKEVSGDPELSRFVSKISEIEKASSERSVSNYKAALDAIRSDDLETFARMPRPKRWRSRDGQDSELEDSRYPAFVFSR